MVNPVKVHGCFSNHQGQIVLRIHLSKAVVRTSSKHEEVLGSLNFCVTSIVPFGVVHIWVGVNVGIAKGRVYGWDDHSA